VQTFNMRSCLDSPLRSIFNLDTVLKRICFNLTIAKKKHKLIHAVVEEARKYYKEDGYHNFNHALLASEAIAESTANIDHWFGMLFHDAHWSRTDDRHNVIASMYRAAKVATKFPELRLNLTNALTTIAYTCYYNNTFINKDSSLLYEVVHCTDLYAACSWDIWPEQYIGLCREVGVPANLKTFYEHVSFIENDIQTSNYKKFVTRGVAARYFDFLTSRRAELDVQSVRELVRRSQADAIPPTHLFASEDRVNAILRSIPLSAKFRSLLTELGLNLVRVTTPNLFNIGCVHYERNDPS
jgi:hypothetical protein